MVETLDLTKILRHVDNLYEAVVIIAKRARQINDEQHAITQQILMEQMENAPPPSLEELEEEDLGPREPIPDYVRFPKPTVLAVQEMIEGKIRFRYIEEEGQEEEV
ncbi:MAG: DNA-directed RNA polymerase subunit omega [candidate division KSB1 bacterium]|nr:DNA-directed RNA polymerase subunit omega [candidate division KSB1 bacterium]